MLAGDTSAEAWIKTVLQDELPAQSYGRLLLVPGAKAPKLIRRDMLRRMRPGSVLVDIAIDQGGCAETSHPTTHHAPVFVEEGVTHYCVANMPAAYSRTATQALTNVTYRYVELLADLGLAEACQRNPALVSGINVTRQMW